MKCDLIGEYYQHVKSCGVYQIINFGLIEATKTHAVIYKSLSDEQIWIRPTIEFFDGRFKKVNANDLSFNRNI